MESMISKVIVGKVIWIPTHIRDLDGHTHTITRTAMATWDGVHKREKWGYNSPLIPLSDTYHFAPGKERFFGRWIKHKDAQLKDITFNGKICTFQELINKKDVLEINRWRYAQLKHFVESLPQQIGGQPAST